MDPLGTDSCRGTVPMEPPMPNCSMRHREPKSEIDDTGQIMQGASCTIAAAVAPTHASTDAVTTDGCVRVLRCYAMVAKVPCNLTPAPPY